MNDLSAQDWRVEANTALMHLSEDFVAASRAVGKIIISEVFLPHEEKVFFFFFFFLRASLLLFNF